MNLADVTPAVRAKNEEYWIYYVLRDLLSVFNTVVFVDTGSTDSTFNIAESMASSNANLIALRIDCGQDANAIGNVPNVLRGHVKTEWMLLVDGDEIWPELQLRALLSHDMLAGKTVGMAIGRNVIWKDGQFLERDGMSADRMFDRSVVWTRTDHPYESHGLYDKLEREEVQYLPVWYWHMRHLDRSSKDLEAFFRQKKKGYFPYAGECKPLPDDWLGEINPNCPNPFLGIRR